MHSMNFTKMKVDFAISPKIISIGNSQFIQDCAIPTIEDLETIATAEFKDFNFGKIEELNSTGPQGEALTLAAFIGIMAGIGTWLSGKVLDEVYERILGKKVRACIERIANSASKKSSFSVALVIGNFTSGATVVIAAIGNDEKELMLAEANITHAIAAITAFPKETQPDTTVYLYKLHGSQFNLKPERHESLIKAIGSLSIVGTNMKYN